MKKKLLLSVLQLLALGVFAQVTVTRLSCEHLVNPVGIGVSHPRFGWQLQSDKRGVQQIAYELKLMAGGKAIWSPGRVNSDQSVNISYEGPALESGRRYSWQVRVWDQAGKASAWSEAANFTTALLTASDWKASWIGPGYTEDETNRPSPLLRKEFSTNKKIAFALAHVTAHGLYEGYINGKRIGDAYLTPGWTSYRKRLQYQTYDVTSLLASGKNALGFQLGSGWYRGYIAWSGNKNSFGSDIALLFQLDITYADGSTESIVSDNSWKSGTGSILSSEIYHGETIDARAERKGWLLPGYDDSNWSGVKTGTGDLSILVANENEPIRKHETFRPIRIFTTPRGERVLDFGQNLVGWVKVKVSGQAGDAMTLSHAEVLDKEGNFYTENLRAAKAEAKYILKGEGQEVFEPHFTFFGFRYVRVTGFTGELSPDQFEAVALYSDMKPTGSFNSSNSLINQLQHNIQWGQRGNFLDVPTDCPQRDERLGWTGDAQAFSRTASFNFGVDNFFSKWLKDLAADQQPSGSVPFVIPNVLGNAAGGSTGWADAATIIPWNMYLAYADQRILEVQYPSMQAWVGYMEKNSRDYLWNTGFHFGDWLFYRPFDDNDGTSAVTDKYLIAQCFYAHSVELLIRAARVLGKQEDADRYNALLSHIREAFLREYVTPSGRLVSGTQTAYVLALNFDMLPESLRAQAAERLVQNVKAYNTHLTTGFLGTPYLCHVLTRFGHTDLAYQLLLQESFPSWLYPVKMGATTIWERWNGIRPDSSFEPASMNSFNHYAYGAIGDWLYRVMVGLDTYEDGPGYKHIRIQPHVGGGFSFASATLQTYYGRLSSSWQVEGDNLLMLAEIPANTRATIYIPAKSIESVTEDGKAMSAAPDLRVMGMENGYVRIEVGSGLYHFTVRK